ncbi:MAG TPA: hypothetical protein DCZ91_21995 [Lachnospiraceae bacterium]|nr:hypothetical protein [Lachnospiraceae bacterium]
MKKNLLSVLILVLMIVNIALSAVMMTNVISTNKKTAELMDSIGAAMNLELYTPGAGPEVSLSDTVTHVMDQMTIPLAYSTNADGTVDSKQTYLVFDISLLMDKNHEDFAQYSGSISDYDSVIKDAVARVVSNYTEEECRASFTEDIRNEMLTAIQNQFQSTFIYGITLSNIKYGG